MRFFTASVMYTVISRRTMPVLLALDRLIRRCCRSNAHLSFESPNAEFDLAIFYHNHFPTHPTPPINTKVQQLARQATSVKYIFTQDGNTDPHTDPSQSAIDVTKTLSFDEATRVEVKNADGFDPPANTPSPHPAIISHLQPFPKASDLCVESALAGAAGGLMAAKMANKVEEVGIHEVSGGEMVGVLAALGREREVDGVWMGEANVEELVRATVGLPTIKRLDFKLPGMPRRGQCVLLSLHSHLCPCVCSLPFSGR